MKTIIVYEDDDLLVCHKCAGFAVQSANPTQADMESELRGYLKGKELYIVHRLDQPVEGLLVFAKNKRAAAGLSKQAGDGMMNKYYRAFVHGEVQPREGVLVNKLLKGKDGLAHVADDAGDSEDQKPSAKGDAVKSAEDKRAAWKYAELSYRVTDYNCDTDVSTVEICLKTGRFHQIRAQFAHRGHPLVGDRKYGAEAVDRDAAAAKATPDTRQAFSQVTPDTRRTSSQAMPQIALCAERLSFLHPCTGRRMEFAITPAFLKV